MNSDTLNAPIQMAKQRKEKPGFLRRLLTGCRWAVRILLVLIVVDIAYLAVVWPDWSKYKSGPVEQSNFIRNYESRRADNSHWPRLHWSPVPLKAIPESMIRAVVVAEDARFFEHSGIDLKAFREAMEYNLSEKRMAYGASTISQQTVKNVFLSSARNPLRKWHELVLTLAMERNLPKRRILEIYLNVAEFGRGIYGVEAAARHYWGIPSYLLTAQQSIELAATLPSPVKNNPQTRTRSFNRRVKKIRRYY